MVLAHRAQRLQTATPTSGSRGPRFSREVEPGLDALRTWDGVREGAALREEAAPDTRLRKAAFKNHSAAELTLTESLMGRTPPLRDALAGGE